MQIDPALRVKLVNSAKVYFKDVYEKCKNGSSKVSEKQIIIKMHEEFKTLSDSWNKVTNRKVFMTSFFTHSQPQVIEVIQQNGKIEDVDKGCEFGDILFIHVEMDLKGDPLCNSLIYQVKVTDTSYKNFDIQERLYTKWPQFRFKIPNSHVTYDVVKQPQSHNGARFLLINNEKDTYLSPEDRYTSNLPDGSAAEVSFIKQIVDILEFEAGRDLITDINPTTVDPVDQSWTDAVHTLIDYGHTRKYAGMPRMKGAGVAPSGNMLFINKEPCCEKYSTYRFINKDNDYPITFHNKSNDGSFNNGILVILIFTSDYPIEFIDKKN
ncbi:hypothetical protein [Gottfriedia acidiceleris]|uniref:hypothetical protein n=1 Tax=Gottfriedia acidiceleris TaxID=371036 RepID=UPI002FFF6FDD